MDGTADPEGFCSSNELSAGEKREHVLCICFFVSIHGNM